MTRQGKDLVKMMWRKEAEQKTKMEETTITVVIAV